MSGWGIADTASPINKIKAESADFLNGLNSCAVIDWDTYSYAFDFYESLIDEAYRQGKADGQTEPHWIPCSERLPEESGLYIVTNVGRWVEPVGTRYYNIRADGGFWSGHPGDKVLAWMPLPEPYQEGADE